MLVNLVGIGLLLYVIGYEFYEFDYLVDVNDFNILNFNLYKFWFCVLFCCFWGSGFNVDKFLIYMCV